MVFNNIHIPEGYEIIRKLEVTDDKSVYLVNGADGYKRVLKVFLKTYKYSIYDRLSKLAHINMPVICGVFLREDCFYVLEEYVEGRTLQGILETEGTFDKKATIEIISQLCNVLMYLHNQLPSIIHRDVKPSNVILADDGIVKLLDFDIAREYKDDAAMDTEVVGTRYFAPPEQYGFSQSDHRTDIYSLGVLLTVMLTNTYDADKIKSCFIRKIVKRCTALDPKKRYKDARLLSNRLTLCKYPATPIKLLSDIDACTYVFPNTRLQIMKLVSPIIGIYLSMLLLAFVQPQPVPGVELQANLVFLTLVVNPQWTATDVQYNVFYTIVYALVYVLFSYIAFAAHDFLMFYYLRGVQRRYLKNRIKETPGIPPFIIASKSYMYCGAALISSTVFMLVIIFSIPHTDVWVVYDPRGVIGLIMILCCVLSFILRGVHYPRYYNKAVRHYYKGNIDKAVKSAKKSAGSKKVYAHAKSWLNDIIRMGDSKK